MVTSSPDPPPARQRFLQRLAELPVKKTAHDYYVRWAKAWTKARGNRSPEATRNFFDALSRSTHLADWQMRQAIAAARILAVDVLALPWALTFDWQGLADQARSPESGHRSFGRESVRVMAAAPDLPPPPTGPLPPLEREIEQLADAMRRAIRLEGLAYATEQTYVGWVVRFIRFCHLKLKRTPRQAGPSAIGAYLNYLALERNISPATQSQALNALAFLTKKVFGIADFTLNPMLPARGRRRPPTVMTREETRSVIAQHQDPWKLAAELMYGAGLRLAECLKLRVKDLDFGQGTITIHDGKGGKHRIVPLPRSLERRLAAHLEKARAKNTFRIFRWVRAMCTCRRDSSANGRTRPGNGPGSTFSPPRPYARIPEPDESPATISTKPPCSATSRTPSARPVSRSESPATPCATASRPISLNPGWIYAPSSP